MISRTSKIPVEIAASWTSRSISPEDAGRRICSTLERLAACSQRLAKWYFPGPPFTGLNDNAEEISSMLKKSADEIAVKRGLGYGLNIWAGNVDQAFALSIHVGATSRWLKNRITFSGNPEQLLDPNTCECILLTFVEVWSPDWAACEPVRHPKESRFELGAQCFLVNPLAGVVFPAHADVCSERPFGFGSLYRLTPDQIKRAYEGVFFRSGGSEEATSQ